MEIRGIRETLSNLPDVFDLPLGVGTILAHDITLLRGVGHIGYTMYPLHVLLKFRMRVKPITVFGRLIGSLKLDAVFLSVTVRVHPVFSTAEVLALSALCLERLHDLNYTSGNAHNGCERR
jgi:hypothetical protein